MALLTPLGAKGQNYTDFTVKQARQLAGKTFSSVQFSGYVNNIRSNGDMNYNVSIQDNFADGAGIRTVVPRSYMTGIQVGDLISVTANGYPGALGYDINHSYISCSGVTDVTKLGSGIAYAFPATLEQLHSAHSSSVVDDPYQSRLVYLQRLAVIRTVYASNGSGWEVEDVDHNRDFIDIESGVDLTEGQVLEGVIAVNLRKESGHVSHLLVRSTDDIFSHTLFQARRLATTNTPVAFTGTVVSRDLGSVIVQAKDAFNITSGIDVNYIGDNPVNIGDIVSIRANQVRFNENAGKVWISNSDLIDVTVIGHDDAPYVRNMTLEGMKNTHYPATRQRVINDIYQHTLVKASNLTVIGHPGYPYGDNDYIVENANGTRDTLTLNSYMNLSPGQQLASVTAVNCRESDSNGHNVRRVKLYVPNLNYIEFPATKTLHYARTHLNQTMVVEGVVNYIRNGNNPCVVIQDNTGGMRLYGSTLSNSLAVGDRIVIQVTPQLFGLSTGSEVYADQHLLLSRLAENESIIPVHANFNDLMYRVNNPGNWQGDNYASRVIDLTNLKVVDKVDFVSGVYLYANESGSSSDPAIRIFLLEQDFSASQWEEISNDLPIGTFLPRVAGFVEYYAYTNTNVAQIQCRSIDDIEIAVPRSISLNVSPTGLSTVTFTASLSQYGGDPITEALPGQQVYLHLSTLTPDNEGVTFLRENLNNYSKLMFHSMACSSQPIVPLTRVNSTCWSFIMPDRNLGFNSIFTPSPNFEAIVSDVWEAREGARQTESDPLKVAYLAGTVTYNYNDFYFFIEDIHNGNTGGDPLKSNNAIRVILSDDHESVNVGDLVYVQGSPTGEFIGNIDLSWNAVLLNKVGHTDLEQPYATDLTTLYNDLFGEGQTIYNSRLQDRLVQLSDLHVDSWAYNLSGSVYNVSQTIDNVTQVGELLVPNGVTLQENSFITAKVINYTRSYDTKPYLVLRSEDDIFGFNEIIFGTNRVEFDEFGGTVSVPLNIGANLSGTPVLSTDNFNISFTATMNSDHTAINIEVDPKTTLDDTQDGLGLITVTVGDVSNTMSVFQSGCAPAEFALNPSYMVHGADDTETHTLMVRNIKHVDTSIGYIWAQVVELENMGTDWITFGNWNEQTHSYPYTLAENTGTEPRGVKIVVNLLGTNGQWVGKEATLWQNPQAAAMSLAPNVVEWGETALCVPVTETITVYYENAFDQTGAYNPYNADYVWLDLWNLGSDFYSDIVVEPEAVPVDESGFGTATFTLTYTPTQTGYHDGTLWARIGEYDFTNHEGIPGGAASPQIWASTMTHDPFFGWVKVTSTDDIESMTMTNYMLVPMDDTELGQDVHFYWVASENAYCIQMMTDYLTWDGYSLSEEYFDPWMDYPEDRFLWTISFDGSDNAVIRPKYDNSYYISWNNDDEYYSYFECVAMGGNPVQIYRLMDGSIPEPTITAPSEWFMDGQSLEITITPAEGTRVGYDYSTDYDEPVYGESATPYTFTTYETTYVEAYSNTCDNSSDGIEHTYYKVNNIYDVRADADNGEVYSIKGVVTYSDNEMLFVQDQSGAIHISKNYINEWILTGEEVIMTGIPQTTNTGQWTTLGIPQYGLTLSDGNTVDPIVTDFYDLMTNPMQYQAQLVKVEGVSVGYHDVQNGYYYLYNSSQMMGLRDTYEGGFPFFLEQGAFIDLTAVFVRNMATGNIDFLIRDDDLDITLRPMHTATLQVYSDEGLSTPNAAWNSYIYFCDESGTPMNLSEFNTNSPVYFGIQPGYDVGLNANNLPVVAVCDATTGETIYDSYTNFMVLPNSNRLFAFSMPDADVVVKVWLEEGSIGDGCDIIFDLVDSWGDGWNNNYLIVSDSYGKAYELTIESGSSATYTLNFTTGTHIDLGWVYGSFSSECSFTVKYGNGYEIYEGSDPEGTELYSFFVDCNTSAPTYDISATADPAYGGIVSGTGTYEYGTTCTLTASANAGYHFVNWIDVAGAPVSTNATYTFTVTQDTAFDAVFEEDPVVTYTITATASPSYGGTVSGGGTFEAGTTCTLTATANAGYHFVNWIDVAGAPVSTNATYTFTVTQDAAFDAVFEEDQPGSDITQTSSFSNGWNWWSGYVELDGANGMQDLQESLGTSGEMIKSQNNGYASYLAGFGWYGSLTSINNLSTYQVKTNSACTVELTGSQVNPADYPITLNSGWTWVGYPVAVDMSVAEALAGIQPLTGDMLKSQNNGYASYLDGFGWYGSLNTLQPGMGLMYKSNNGSAVTLVYPNGGTRTDLKDNQTAESNHWLPNLNAYPDNMSVMAVVELDGNELQGENYELAAFANGEVRGSARLLYVEPLNRYMAFLTVAGDEACELRFRLYNNETGTMVETVCTSSLQYETNAIVGAYAEPYVVSFRTSTSLDELESQLRLFPNPVSRGEMLNIDMPVESLGKVSVEIVNALGIVVRTVYRSSVQTIAAPDAAGVYTLRINVEGNGTYCRKLVVR